MTPICTYENHNLGDQMVFLHLLRALAKANPSRVFFHFAQDCHIEQMYEVVCDLPNISLFGFGSEEWPIFQSRAVDIWKNRGGTGKHDGFWERSKNRWNWSAFTLEHHAHIAGLLGLRSPFTIREELLFDYPALNPNNSPGDRFFYDFLFIDNEPCSGQFSPMKQHGSGYLSDLIKQLAKKFSVITTNPVYGVECTRDTKKSVTDIGRLSLKCKHHIMIATGPMWPCLNTTNHHNSSGRLRAVLLDNGEDLNLPGIKQCASREDLIPLLKQFGV